MRKEKKIKKPGWDRKEEEVLKSLVNQKVKGVAISDEKIKPLIPQVEKISGHKRTINSVRLHIRQMAEGIKRAENNFINFKLLDALEEKIKEEIRKREEKLNILKRIREAIKKFEKIK